MPATLLNSQTAPSAGRRNALLIAALLQLILLCLPFPAQARAKTPALPQQTGYAAFPGAHIFVDQYYTNEQRVKPDVVLVDVRPREEYTVGHLPGAISIPVHLWRTGFPAYQLFHQDADLNKPYDIQRYEQFLGERGISQSQEVIIYGNAGEQDDLAIPVFVLDWLGHPRLHFFDGDAVKLWQDSGFVLDQRTPAINATVYKAHPHNDMLWNKDQILERLDVNDPNFVLWDCRSPEEYAGEVMLKDMQLAGHIAGAVNLHQEELFRDNKNWQVRFYHEAKILLEKKGVAAKKRIVIYCHDGGRSAYAYILLRAMGYDRIAVYDHSWIEWQQDRLLPRLATYQNKPEVRSKFPRRKFPEPPKTEAKPVAAPASTIEPEWYHPRNPL